MGREPDGRPREQVACRLIYQGRSQGLPVPPIVSSNRGQDPQTKDMSRHFKMVWCYGQYLEGAEGHSFMIRRPNFVGMMRFGDDVCFTVQVECGASRRTARWLPLRSSGQAGP